MDNIQFKQIRYNLGWSLRDMAELLGTNPKTIRRMEMDPCRSSRLPIFPDTAEKLLDFLANHRGN